jgi:hypothetical protein
MAVSIIVVANPNPNGSPATFTYAIKVSDIAILKQKLINDLNSITQFQNEDDKIEQLLKNEAKYYGNPQVDLEEKFLVKYNNYGITLYKADDNLLNWNELKLVNNGTSNTVNSIPCPQN